MKILLLGTHLEIGGIPRYLVSLTGELVKQGHDVFVATSGGTWEELLREKGGIPLFVDIRTKSGLSLKVWRSARTLRAFLARNRIDVLHANTRVTQVVARLLSNGSRIPYVTTCHGFYRRKWGRVLFPCWGKKTIAISEMVHDHLIEDFGLKEEQVRLIPNGVDVAHFHPTDREGKERIRKELGLPERGSVIGSVSRLVKVKGHHALLHGVASLQRKYPDLALVLVGEGESRAALERTVNELGIKDRVFFRGEVADPLPYLLAFDLFIHPSQWDEGFGLAPAEAMACGLPVVACKGNKGGMRMFISHEENGYLLDGRDPEHLRVAIDALLKDPSLCEKMGEKGRKTIAERFSAERMAGEVLKVYEEVIR